MKIIRRKNSTDWRALGVLLLLLTNVFAPSIKPFFPQPITCGMSCCEASGVCYCQSQHTDDGDADKTAAQSDRRTVSSGDIGISQSCPTRCAQIPAGFQKHSTANVNPPQLVCAINMYRRLFNRKPHLAFSTLMAESRSPRAPPAICL